MSEPENNERTESTVATPSIREVERELARHRFKLFLCGVALLLPVLLAIKIWSGAEEERRTAKIVARLDGQSRRLDDTVAEVQALAEKVDRMAALAGESSARALEGAAAAGKAETVAKRAEEVAETAARVAEVAAQMAEKAAQAADGDAVRVAQIEAGPRAPKELDPKSAASSAVSDAPPPDTGWFLAAFTEDLPRPEITGWNVAFREGRPKTAQQLVRGQVVRPLVNMNLRADAPKEPEARRRDWNFAPIVGVARKGKDVELQEDGRWVADQV